MYDDNIKDPLELSVLVRGYRGDAPALVSTPKLREPAKVRGGETAEPSNWSRSQFVANCSILFAEITPLERPAAARDAGFEMIESWWPFPSADPDSDAIDAWVRAVESAGVRLVAQNFFSGTADERGILAAADRESEFNAAIKSLGEIAVRLDCHMFNAPYGRLDARRPAVEQHATARRHLEQLADFATGLDATILLEPMSGIPDYPLTSVADVDAVTASLSDHARERIGLLADLYHLGRNGEDVDALLARPSAITHVQIADAPGRHEPGTGSLPIRRWLRALERNGYDRQIALEYEPGTDAARAFDWLTV
jgi:hydroxypyruvate isomerase